MSTGSIGRRFLMPEALQPTGTPERDPCGLRKRDGCLSSAAVGKDRANDPSRPPFKVAMCVWRQDPSAFAGAPSSSYRRMTLRLCPRPPDGLPASRTLDCAAAITAVTLDRRRPLDDLMAPGALHQGDP